MREKKYVDSNMLCDLLLNNFNNVEVVKLQNVLDVIKEQPFTDVDEIVRCKDCVYRKTEDCPMSNVDEDGQFWSWESNYCYCNYGKSVFVFTDVDTD